MKVTLNSNLFPIIRVGMYNSNISPEEIIDDYNINDDKENGHIHYNSDFYWDNFNNSKYIRRIEELAKEYLSEPIDDTEGNVINIKCKGIYSPKFYNFSTDEIVMEVKYNKTQLLKVSKKERETFELFLKMNYTSRDGFMSMTSNNYDDWLVGFKDNDVRDVGAILSYIYQDWENEDYGTFDEYVRNEIQCYSEFIDCEDYENEIKVLETYVKENYQTIQVDNINSEMFDFEILDDETCRQITKGIIETIENNTMSMF